MSPNRAGLAGFVLALGICALTVLPHGSTAVAGNDPKASQHCAGNVALAIPASGAPSTLTTFAFPPQSGQPVTHGQSIANCEAWQDFIYANWPASAPGIPDANATAADFGKPVTDPSKTKNTVWESYATSEEAFRGARPTAARRVFTFAAGNEYLGNNVHLGSIGQATRGWITGQNRGLVFYDAWVNNDEYAYINDPDNKLKTKAGQTACAIGPAPRPGLQLPMPSALDCAGKEKKYGLGIGAMEIKAAFLDMSGLPEASLKKFLIAQGVMCYPSSVKPKTSDVSKGACKYVVDGVAYDGWLKQAVIGLVGLHIVHKVKGAEQMLWETFEHVDNDPNAPGGSTEDKWTFYKPGAGDQPKQPPKPCPTTGCTPFDTPSQILRQSAATIDADAQMANSDFQAALTAAKTDSVFKYYQLVQVQWPTASVAIVPGAQVGCCDRPVGAVVPADEANTVIETYGQRVGQASCVECHAGGSQVADRDMPVARAGGRLKSAASMLRTFEIRRGKPASAKRLKAGAKAEPVPQATGEPYFADYSFVFSNYGGPQMKQ